MLYICDFAVIIFGADGYHNCPEERLEYEEVLMGWAVCASATCSTA